MYDQTVYLHAGVSDPLHTSLIVSCICVDLSSFIILTSRSKGGKISFNIHLHNT